MTKTIIVGLSTRFKSEHEIDPEIFDDPFLEAATQAIEKVNGNSDVKIRAIIECHEKGQKKSHMYNAYWILLNASCFQKAEDLRQSFLSLKKVDLHLQPVKG